VLIHAVCDALLGAAALRDIGYHFPDTSKEFKGIRSTILLERVVELLKENDYAVGNVDCTIALQEPKISKFIPFMQENMASIMNLTQGSVSVKATTTEQLGFTGRGEGVAVWAVAMIYSTKD
jgi:2-C-methyl-D-erythritol 2,4-cyclodiphosphate synthase